MGEEKKGKGAEKKGAEKNRTTKQTKKKGQDLG